MKNRPKIYFIVRTFSNGNALGGHIRSHMMNHQMIPQDQTDSFSDDEEGHGVEAEKEDDHGDSYVVGSVFVLQDRESETESCKNPTRRRSKRTRKSAIFDHHLHYAKLSQQDHHREAFKKMKLRNKIDSYANNNVEPAEPVSSISDATTEEDVAFCLMMLSRDKWKTQHKKQEEQDDDDDVGVGYRSLLDESDDQSDEEQLIKFQRSKSTRGKYKCETCNRVFKSYQALGGHRASHKKMKASSFAAAANNPNPNRVVYEAEAGEEINHNAGGSSFVKTHECPVCFRVFSSGQALGGHKRSHVTGSAAISNIQSMKSLAKLGDSMIDLNLPAPADDDEIDTSQIEISALSDAEFFNPTRR